MKIVLVIFSLISFNANAFHAVSEILPGGQLLICKDYGQVKKGNIVENFVRSQPRSQHNNEMVKKSEFSLPEVGSRITLLHKDFHFFGKNSNKYHQQELGSAIVVETRSLIGVKRSRWGIPSFKTAQLRESISLISEQEAQEIDQKCFVAVAENGLFVNENASVNW